MTPGQIVRRLLGPAFRPVGEAYRRIFVDMPRVADEIARQLPPNARVLDVGGGDGYVVNLLLDRRPDITVTMTDLAAEIGTFISSENRTRVTLLPATDVGDVAGGFDVATLADVLHHVPASERARLLAHVAEKAPMLIVKDIEPGNLRSVLSLLSDWYITGDKGVRLISERAATDLARAAGYRPIRATSPSWANYCLTLARGP